MAKKNKIKLANGRPKVEDKKVMLSFSVRSSVIGVTHARELSEEKYRMIKDIAENAIRLALADGTIS